MAPNFTIKPIIPARFIEECKEDALRHIIEQVNADEASDVVKDYQSTTGTWNHQPEFRIQAQGVNRSVSTDDEVYAYVDKGTRPHDIAPVNAPALKFTVPFVPKTQPGRLGSSSGSRGNQFRSAKRVRHPGTRPRGFTDLIMRQSKERHRQRMNRAMGEHFK